MFIRSRFKAKFVTDVSVGLATVYLEQKSREAARQARVGQKESERRLDQAG